MSALDHSTFETPAHVRPALGLRVINQVGRFLRAWKNRREIYRLGDMSDAQLADIGLVRSDLHVAWQTPVGLDPTARLGTLSEARFRAAEAAARRVS
jgi:uncharacterized protein YjiS (DUF1127 family)